MRSLFLLIFASISIVYSQEADVDTVYNLDREILVFSNTRLLAPNKLQVYSGEFIKKTNAGQLSELLKMADGVYVKDYGFNSGLKTISVNSTQSEQALIIFNGMRLNSRQNSYFDTGLLRLDDVSDITISSGGSSALYGSDAIGGVINIFSGDAISSDKKTVGINLKTGIGSYGMKNIYGKLKIQKADVLSLTVSYNYESSSNKYLYHYNNGISNAEKERENSDYINHSVNINSVKKINTNSTLSWFLLYGYWNKGIPGIETGYNSSTSRQIDRDLISSVSLNSKISRKINYTGSLGFRYSLMSYYDTATFTFINPVNSFYKLRLLSHMGIVGIKINDETDAKIIYEGNLTDFTSNETEKANTFQSGISINFRKSFGIKPFKAISFFPSIRYDYFSNLSAPHILTGKIGMNFQPVKNMAVKGSIGNNFRAPSFNDLYWNGLGNKELRPERSISIDGGFIFSIKFLGEFETEATYFHIRTTDRILWSPGAFNIWRPGNIGEVVSQGVDLSVRLLLKYKKSWDFQSGVSYNISEAIKTGKDYEGDPTYNKQLIYIPKQQFKANLVINYLPTSKILKSLSLMLFYNYAGKRYSNLENTIFAPYYETLDGNIQLVCMINETDIGVKFSVNNILNKDYQVVSGYPMPLRNFKTELSIKY